VLAISKLPHFTNLLKDKNVAAAIKRASEFSRPDLNLVRCNLQNGRSAIVDVLTKPSDNLAYPPNVPVCQFSANDRDPVYFPYQLVGRRLPSFLPFRLNLFLTLLPVLVTQVFESALSPEEPFCRRLPANATLVLRRRAGWLDENQTDLDRSDALHRDGRNRSFE
jgi:hypothetical protein